MDNFNTVHERKHTRSVKWDNFQDVFNTEDLLPMWVADMDFKAPEAVNDALIKRAEHGIYGYTVIDSDVKDSIVNWVDKRFNRKIDANWLSFSPGVVTSLHMLVQTFTEPGDSILIQPPVYTPFYEVIENHQRNIVKNPLVLKDDHYEIDFADFEAKLKQGVKAFLLCSPHNPVGRVWKKGELQKVAELCLAYDVLILADEIHADLTLNGHRHIPIATLSHEVAEQTITCMAPSKTFNLAGLQASYMITENADLKKKIDHAFAIQGLSALNTMGNTALEAAYRSGEPWLNELTELLASHQDYVIHMFNEHASELKVIPAEGTYLLWIDCHQLKMDDKTLKQFMIKEAKIGLNAGLSYGSEGSQFMRMNIACPRETLEEGIKRIIHAVNSR